MAGLENSNKIVISSLDHESSIHRMDVERGGLNRARLTFADGIAFVG